jgi:N-methylhydantoinase A
MAHSSGKSRVGIDVGGTFIDYAVVDTNSGAVSFGKEPANVDQLHQWVLAGLHRMGLSGTDVAQLFHGATVAINALVQEQGARVALVTTAGFRDVLAIGRGGRQQIYNLRFAPAPPLVPRDLRLEVTERLDASGNILTPLDPESVDTVTAQIDASGAEAVAICLLHAYVNPTHELAVAAAIRTALPHVLVTMSHQVASEWHEYERTSTTVINSFVQPLFGRYLDSLESTVAADGYTGTIGIMQSNGGVSTVERAGALPVRTLMSGPAGGVVAGRELARELGIVNAVCADVGGTTFDVALILDGELVEKSEATIEGRPVLGSLVDITSVGAGGGSIARIDAKGALKVGPDSAGAVPGPACFGAGGENATVTDAQVLLSRLDPSRFLGGRMSLDLDSARDAIDTQIARPLGLSVEEGALGILRIAESNMTNAIRSITVQRGLDPRDFALIAYGGGGGLFAAPLAEGMGVTTVVSPAAAANFSAWGILSSDYREDVVRTRLLDLDTSAPVIVTELSKLRGELIEVMSDYGDRTAVEVTYTVDARFVGQHHTVSVPVDAAWLDDESELVTKIGTGFRRLHDRMYGPRTLESALEIVTLRAHGTLPVQRPRLNPVPEREVPTTLETRQVWFGEKPSSAVIHQRADLGAGATVEGPAIVEEATNTVLVPPGWIGRVEPSGHLILTNAGGSE